MKATFFFSFPLPRKASGDGPDFTAWPSNTKQHVLHTTFVKHLGPQGRATWSSRQQQWPLKPGEAAAVAVAPRIRTPAERLRLDVFTVSARWNFVFFAKSVVSEIVSMIETFKTASAFKH